VLKACIEARAALAELKQAAELIPNQAMLINTIPLLEAKDSSEIENIVTTTDQLFQYAPSTPARRRPATKEALRYRTALLRRLPVPPTGRCAPPRPWSSAAPSRVWTWTSAARAGHRSSSTTAAAR
jgi:Fic family protein